MDWAYTAGASLFRPMVKKKREINWKQSSSTLSTTGETYQPQPNVEHCFGRGRTSILLQWLPMLFSYLIELMYLLDNLIIEPEDIIRFDICRSVLLQQGELIPEEKHTIKYGCFLWIERSPDGGGVSHSGAG